LNSNSATVEQFLAEIECCNSPADSPRGSERAAAGHPAPFGVRYWQIGNEQRGEEYEQRMIDYARAIRVRTGACGICATDILMISLGAHGLPSSPCRFQEMNSEGWFRVDLRSEWVTRAEVLFIKPRKP